MDGKSREGMFYIDKTGNATARAPDDEPAFVQPVAQVGRESHEAFALSGPVQQHLVLAHHDALWRSGQWPVVRDDGPPSTKRQEALCVTLVDANAQPVTLKSLTGSQPRSALLQLPRRLRGRAARTLRRVLSPLGSALTTARRPAPRLTRSRSEARAWRLAHILHSTGPDAVQAPLRRPGRAAQGRAESPDATAPDARSNRRRPGSPGGARRLDRAARRTLPARRRRRIQRRQERVHQRARRQPVLEEGVTPTTAQINVLQYGDRTGRQVRDAVVDASPRPCRSCATCTSSTRPAPTPSSASTSGSPPTSCPRSDLVLFVTSRRSPLHGNRARLPRADPRAGARRSSSSSTRSTSCEGDGQIDEVRGFVRRRTRRRCSGFTPEIFPVSAQAGAAREAGRAGAVDGEPLRRARALHRRRRSTRPVASG